MNNRDIKSCFCKKDDGLFLSLRQVRMTIATTLSCLFLSFIVGYFVGTHDSIDQMAQRIQTASFADHIYTTLCAQHDQEQEQVAPSEEKAVGEASLAPQLAPHLVQQLGSHVAVHENNLDEKPAIEYYAQLIGFGNRSAAEQFAQRLEKKNIPVIVNNRQSKSCKGKPVTWYQVVTTAYADRQELERVLEKVVDSEKLNGVRIVSTKKGITSQRENI